MSEVAVLKTSPKTVTKDYTEIMHLANYRKPLSKTTNIILKLNLSWTLFFPACSTQPWQLEGVTNTLISDGFKKITAVENQTVVTHPWKGAYGNKWLPILKKHNIPYQPLTDAEWINYKPKKEMLAMSHIFKEILIPKDFLDSYVIHLPTIKTHGHTTTTGAMKNAFGGLIPKYRHHAHLKIHEVLVDLLSIQKEIHKGIFSVMDGAICGNGAGPRTMDPVIGNIIIASKDQVAIDAVAAKIMGFDPLRIPYIKMAHDRGLGNGDIESLEIIGLSKKELRKINLHFKVKKSPIIQGDQLLRKKTASTPVLHNLLFKSPFFKTFIFASEFYHDYIWYPIIGRRKVNEFLNTEWGRLFKEYSYGPYPKYKKITNWNPY